MANFSGAVKITDLNDFINPSQECVKPVIIERHDIKDGIDKRGTIEIDDDGTYTSVQNGIVKKKLEKVKITLNDCLACSGCITSAETILVSQQSQEELYKVLRHNRSLPQAGGERKIVVVSVSPQSRASLAAYYHLSLPQTSSRLTHFFKSLGVDCVFDTTFANDLCILQNCREFVRRYRRRDADKTALPMLASSCPGWICYAEKTHGRYILPYLSAVKSPQQITASLVKNHFAESRDSTPAQIYHVTVMPCYDKKLEASRPDFFDAEFETRDVDCVLTTGEVLSMLEQEQTPLSEITTEAQLDNLYPCTRDDAAAIYKHRGGASGGYLDHIVRYAAAELFDVQLDSLVYKVIRNRDMQEVSVEKDGEVVLRMALAYGFRNIQIVVQKVKQGKCPYHYVEVMACPSGCNNGGGQILADGGETAKERLARVNEVYESAEERNPHDNPVVLRVIETWLGGSESEKCRGELETSYHYVEKTDNLLNMAW